MEIIAGQSFPIGGHPTIEIATNSKRSLLNQIEAELQNSEIYQKVLASLKTMLGDAGAKADTFLAAVGREAIQLALKKMTKKSAKIPKTDTSPKANNSETKAKEEPVEVEVCSEKQEERSLPSPTKLESTGNNSSIVVSSSTENEESKKEASGGSPKKEKPKKLSKTERAALELASKRKEVLENIGQELRKARVTRCLSIKEVHAQTLVPANHVDAIEKGDIEKLPEDIYVRGFIYRLGNALGLDGANMAAALPALEPLQGMIPSWYGSNTSSGPNFELHPMHLYLGYTALMAGAVGGLTVVTQQSVPGANFTSSLPDGETEAIAPSNRDKEVTATPGLRFSQTGIVVGSDIAPPETMN